MSKIEFNNDVLYRAFKIEWALPEKGIENYHNEALFEPDTPQEDIDKQFEYELKHYLHKQESAWESYLSFTEAIEKVVVYEDKTIFVISDTEKLLKSILKCINGYGEFYFSSVNELIKTTNGTDIKTIKSHFFWLKYYSEIYGRTSIDRIMEDYLNS
jgi:hypothetical protein